MAGLFRYPLFITVRDFVAQPIDVFPVERVREDVTVRAVEDCRKGIDTRIDDQFVPQPPPECLALREPSTRWCQAPLLPASDASSHSWLMGQPRFRLCRRGLCSLVLGGSPLRWCWQPESVVVANVRRQLAGSPFRSGTGRWGYPGKCHGDWIRWHQAYRPPSW